MFMNVIDVSVLAIASRLNEFSCFMKKENFFIPLFSRATGNEQTRLFHWPHSHTHTEII